MGLRMKNFDIMVDHWKIWFLGGVMKIQYLGGITKKGGHCQLYPNTHYWYDITTWIDLGLDVDTNTNIKTASVWYLFVLSNS